MTGTEALLATDHRPPTTLFVYEWVTGGGLVGQSGPLPESLLREGLAMATAVADDAWAAGVRPLLMRDLRVATLGAAGSTIEVDSRAAHDEAFDRLCGQADALLLIAPETDGALLQAVRRAEANGARLVSPGASLVEIASNKQRTAETLAAAGVPMPESIALAPDKPLPEQFAYPAVVKPIDGAGSQDTHVVAHPRDRPPAYAWPRRLERFVPGVPASVAVVGVTDGEPIILPPCRQRLSTDGRLRFLGGETPLAPGLTRRTSDLARRVAAALPPAIGYFGIDLVLGDDPDGANDRVLEVNPRLTTSYVALRRAIDGGLVPAMLAAAAGERVELQATDRPLSFDADGVVYWSDEA